MRILEHIEKVETKTNLMGEMKRLEEIQRISMEKNI